MKPVIINKKSNFVVITYWWGRCNINKNLQDPCPYEMANDSNLKLKKQGKTYEKMIKDWVQCMKSKKINYLVVEYPEFAVKGGYQNAINYKPYFIEEALRACYPRSVLYIDGDMKIETYPKIFDTLNIDFSGRAWGIDIDGAERLCYDPYVFETSGGTLFFGQTKFGYLLLKLWKNEMEKYKGKAEDRVLSLIINNKKLVKDFNIIQLPIEYLWMNLLYEKNTFIKKHRPCPIITHPFCITTEEAAIELSDELLKNIKNRNPFRYEYYVENNVRCDRITDTIYEYIVYEDKKISSQHKYYNKWLKKNGHNIISYSNKYGDFNKIANINKNKMKLLQRISDNKIIIVSLSSNSYNDSYNIHFTSKSLLIPTILLYLKNNQSVIYMPNLRSPLNYYLKKASDGYEFIAVNENRDKRHFKSDYMLKLNDKNPMYFSANSRVLYHLLYMSENLKKVQYHFNKSSTFIFRIRCNWK
jgi:hypothetical protein